MLKKRRGDPGVPDGKPETRAGALLEGNAAAGGAGSDGRAVMQTARRTAGSALGSGCEVAAGSQLENVLTMVRDRAHQWCRNLISGEVVFITEKIREVLYEKRY